jgi:hypothetical protein
VAVAEEQIVLANHQPSGKTVWLAVAFAVLAAGICAVVLFFKQMEQQRGVIAFWVAFLLTIIWLVFMGTAMVFQLLAASQGYRP